MNYALITGSSKGIGKAIAECLAKRKYDLLLIARSEGLLQQVAEELNHTYGVDVKYLALDLSTADAPARISDWVAENKFPVSVLVNNAGYGLWGDFRELSLEEQNNMLRLNIMTPVDLTYLMIPVLQRQPQSYILNTGSMAGFLAIPHFNLYSASKALVNTFTRALIHELKGTNISVSLLAPGSVRTGFVERARMQHMEKSANKVSMGPEEIAAAAVDGMFKKKREIIPGFINRLTVFMIKLFPKTVIENIADATYKKKN
ncbi:MAG: SDR family oxidoreductase [Ginsengibacter sp.]